MHVVRLPFFSSSHALYKSLARNENKNKECMMELKINRILRPEKHFKKNNIYPIPPPHVLTLTLLKTTSIVHACQSILRQTQITCSSHKSHKPHTCSSSEQCECLIRLTFNTLFFSLYYKNQIKKKTSPISYRSHTIPRFSNGTCFFSPLHPVFSSPTTVRALHGKKKKLFRQLAAAFTCQLIKEKSF